MKRKKVLITGGEGFLGMYLIQWLLQKGSIEIIVFDKLKSTKPTTNTFVAHIQGDVLSKSDLETVWARYGPFHTVYHLASAMPNRAVSDELTWRTNVIGTDSVAAVAVEHGAQSFIFTSTNVTYGVPDTLPVTEETPVRPIEVYGKSKVEAELELAKYKHRINIQIFRCPVITGVGRLGLQSILFEFISENRNVYVLGDGGNRYQFIDATDVAAALEKASQMKGFDIYTIGADAVVTLRELYQKLIDYAKSESKIISLPKTITLAALSLLDKLRLSPLGIYQYTMIGQSLYADTTKIKTKLGWRPQKTNLDSFVENYTWYTQHKGEFNKMGSGSTSDNRSLPKMKIFTLLKLLS